MKYEESDLEILSTEELNALYCVDLLKPSYKLYRLNSLKARIYFRESPFEKGKYQLFLGTTSVGALLPMEKALLYWIAKKGVDEAAEYARQRAVYGSFYHTILADYIILGELDIDLLPSRIHQYAFENKVPFEIAESWTEEIKLDFLSFAQWVIDFNVRPLAIELPLCSEVEGVGTLIDMVAWVNDKNYKKTAVEERKQHLAIIDFKSGKSGFRKPHYLQLCACVKIFQENYPNHAPIQALYNFAPKAWRGATPTFTFTNQTDKMDEEEYDHYIGLAKKKLKGVIVKPLRVLEGVQKLGEPVTDHVIEKTIEDVINSDYWQKYLTEQSVPEVAIIES